jgi:FixJ family two-component response regulator
MEPNGTKQASATVYVVENDKAIRDVLISMIGIMRLAAVGYGSAEEFLTAYDLKGHACLLSDMELPGMSGLQLQAEMKQRAPGLPIIFATDWADESAKQEALRQGAVAILPKPCRMRHLARVVEKALGLVRRV